MTHETTQDLAIAFFAIGTILNGISLCCVFYILGIIRRRLYPRPAFDTLEQ